MKTQRSLVLMIGLLTALLLTGCLRLKPQPDPVRFYVLSAPTVTAQPGADSGGAQDRPLFVGRVEAPDYLGHPGIALRWSEARIDYSPVHQWAEPLRDGATRVLRDALSRRLGPGRVHAATIRRPAGPHLDLQITLLRFEATATDEVVLQARWQIVQEPERELIEASETAARREYHFAADDFSSAVLALSGSLEDLATVIVTRLREVERW